MQMVYYSRARTFAEIQPNIESLGADAFALTAFLREHGVTALPRLNAAPRLPLRLTARQQERIARFYVGDFALLAQLAAAREQAAPAGIAAE